VHTTPLAAGAPGGTGPNLAGLVGRRLGGDPEFDYSPVLRAALAGGVWDAERLDRFLVGPKSMLLDMWMSVQGISDAAERRRLIEFLICGGAK
jgi:cytochrome c